MSTAKSWGDIVSLWSFSKYVWQKVAKIPNQALKNCTGSIMSPLFTANILIYHKDQVVSYNCLFINVCKYFINIYHHSNSHLEVKNGQTCNIRRASIGNKMCWSVRCIWSTICWRCSNYIFILDFTPGFNRLRKENWKTRREILKFEIWCVLYKLIYGKSRMNRNSKKKLIFRIFVIFNAGHFVSRRPCILKLSLLKLQFITKLYSQVNLLVLSSL